MGEHFEEYRRAGVTQMRPYVPGEVLVDASISKPDAEAGSPKEGDFIARNPANHADRWLVSAAFFASAKFVKVQGAP